MQKKFHGEGILVTSDEETASLYEQASFTVLKLPRERRESLEGWRIRKHSRCYQPYMMMML